MDERAGAGLTPGDSFGRWLRRRRMGLELTRAALGQRVGYSVATIRKIEAEERRPSLQLAAALADLFQIPVEQRAAFIRFARGQLLAAPPPAPVLPAATSSFIGREAELAAVRRYLADDGIRLLTLVGPPGIGKTRLSLEVAWALAPLAEPEQVARAAVHALGLVAREGYAAAERLQAGIGTRELLLILDNAEHLVDAVADLVAALLPACPRLNILCTSRESLRVRGEWLYPLAPLACPEPVEGDFARLAGFPALQLFAERARTVLPDFALTAENVGAVATICRELDGLPLAIELIAARIRLLSPAELLARLDSGFTLSADGMRGVPARQKSMQEAIAWSYNLLSESERQLFAGLSVFAGGFTLAAVEGVFGKALGGQATGELLSSLQDKSLVQRIVGRHGQPRLLILVTIRQFAAARLQELGAEAAQRDRHLAYFLELAEQAAPELSGPDQVAGTNRVAAEFDNFRTALEWGVAREDCEKAMRLLIAIAWAWFLRGHTVDVRDWFERVTVLPGAGRYPLILARLLIHMARQNWLTGALDEANVALAQAETLAEGLGSAAQRELGYVRVYRGSVLRSQGDSSGAIAQFEQALPYFDRSGDRRGTALAVHNLGWTAVFEADAASGQPLLERSLGLYQELGDHWGVARVSQGLGVLYMLRGELEQARGYYQRHLAIDEALEFRLGTAAALWNLGDLHRRLGDYARARHYCEDCRVLSHTYDLPWDKALAAYGLAMVALHENEVPSAGTYFHHYYLDAPGSLGHSVKVDLLFGFAAIAAATNQPQRAARLLGAGEALQATAQYRIDAFDRAEFERHLDRAREQLGDEPFAARVEEGRQLGPEQALAYALEEAGGDR